MGLEKKLHLVGYLIAPYRLATISAGELSLNRFLQRNLYYISILKILSNQCVKGGHLVQQRTLNVSITYVQKS